MKFESDSAKNCSRYRVHKVLYTECQMLTLTFDPVTQNQQGFSSLSTTYMWSLKVIGQKL